MLRISDELRGRICGSAAHDATRRFECAADFSKRGGGGGQGRRNPIGIWWDKEENQWHIRVQLHARTCRAINLTSSAEDETGLWRWSVVVHGRRGCNNKFPIKFNSSPEALVWHWTAATHLRVDILLVAARGVDQRWGCGFATPLVSHHKFFCFSFWLRGFAKIVLSKVLHHWTSPRDSTTEPRTIAANYSETTGRFDVKKNTKERWTTNCKRVKNFSVLFSLKHWRFRESLMNYFVVFSGIKKTLQNSKVFVIREAIVRKIKNQFRP